MSASKQESRAPSEYSLRSQEYRRKEYEEKDENVVHGIYVAPRNEKFTEFIRSLVRAGGISESFILKMTTPENMEIYKQVFTTRIANPYWNYEYYEMLGDSTCNKFIVSYFFTRFPQLKTPEGIKVVARLKNNYCSKQSFHGFAKKMGFEEFVSCTLEEKKSEITMKSVLEDVFEAFIGATEVLADFHIRAHCGYIVVYELLKRLFDVLEISLDYADLFDAKTRLKELFSFCRERDPNFGTIRYDTVRVKEQFVTKAVRTVGTVDTVLFTGSDITKPDSDQKAAVGALKILEDLGFKKTEKSVYTEIKEGVKKIDYNRELQNGIVGINDLISTKPKKIGDQPYGSTRLAGYCFKRDYAAMKVYLANEKVDVNVLDSEGWSCLDLLLYGKIEPGVKDGVKMLLDRGCVSISKRIFEEYYSLYFSEQESVGVKWMQKKVGILRLRDE